jgi:hypothetical protein
VSTTGLGKVEQSTAKLGRAAIEQTAAAPSANSRLRPFMNSSVKKKCSFENSQTALSSATDPSQRKPECHDEDLLLCFTHGGQVTDARSENAL